MHRFVLKALWLTLFFTITACATQSSRVPSTSIAPAPQTDASSSGATSIPPVTTLPMSVDDDGYHVIGDPAAPIVLTDYSDYF